MIKKRIVVALAVMCVLAFGAMAQASRILLVSDAAAPGTDPAGDHEDDQFVDWLGSIGHTVNTHGMGEEMRGTFDAADQAAIDAADVVIVSRRTSSGSYNDPVQWNEVDKPLILQSGFLTRNTRWGWTPSGSSDTDPTTTDMIIGATRFFDGVPVSMFDWSTAPTPGEAPKPVFLPDADPVDADVVGSFDDQPMLFELPEGTDLGGKGTLGGRRAFLGHWGYDDDGADYRWDDFITPNYKQVLGNVIEEIPEPASVMMLLSGILAVALYGFRKRKA